nr:MAG TPA_asm: SOS-response transcriptional repressor [Caudoviricetes sp.]DAL20478.1 MAG TPA_asm: SOS-response transcriptional repressor [Caudoviricetes sp.]
MLGYSVLDEYAARSGVKKKEIANLIGVSKKTLWNKLSGKTDFTYGEAAKIRDTFFPAVPLEWLFEREVPNA